MSPQHIVVLNPYVMVVLTALPMIFGKSRWTYQSAGMAGYNL
jgi:hypothetical protein